MTLLIGLVHIIYALVGPLSKITLYYSSPLFITASRMLIAGITVLGYQFTFRREKFTISRDILLYLIIGSIFSVYLTNWLEFEGLKNLTPAKTAFLCNLYPFASALLAVLILKEKLTKTKWLGLAIGFLGSLPLLFEAGHQEIELYKYFGFLSIAEIAVIVSVFSMAFGWTYLQKAICEKDCDAVMVNGTTMFAGGLIALIHSLFVETWSPIPVINFKMFLLTLFGLIILYNICFNSLYIELLKKYPLTFLSFTGFVVPLLTAFFDWLFFGYSVSWLFYFSTGIMFIGFYLFFKEEFK